ncbi:hypothetical protein [Streptomyces sp. Caat 7-52]|uniref:hypothetical protein n=1 Tax=Streptomyces sp. Caat 7-52 TaxID=2949637 RepID=UPI002035A53D|nr:hypothetical protein [Streptomyces sp. Caat 7-52]
MDRLQQSAWQYAAEAFPLEELPMLAAHALVDGRDSPALRELAGLPRRSDGSEIRELYVRALHELGIPLPDEETAGRCLLVSLAFGLEKGELRPEDVAHRLSMTVAASTPEETQFLSVAAEYSEWISLDELPGWENDLRTAAHSLTAATGLGSLTSTWSPPGGRPSKAASSTPTSATSPPADTLALVSELSETANLELP